MMLALSQWICNPTYSIKEVYEHSLVIQHKVRWRHLIWHRFSIPKARFICWLSARQGLKTKERLYLLGVVVDDLCPLCGLHPETHNNLFFNCPFSRSCVVLINSWIGVTFKPISRMDFWKCRLSRIKQHVLISIFASTKYHVWKCRNEAVWHSYVRSPSRNFNMIKHDIRQKCHALNLLDVVDIF